MDKGLWESAGAEMLALVLFTSPTPEGRGLVNEASTLISTVNTGTSLVTFVHCLARIYYVQQSCNGGGGIFIHVFREQSAQGNREKWT